MYGVTHRPPPQVDDFFRCSATHARKRQRARRQRRTRRGATDLRTVSTTRAGQSSAMTKTQRTAEEVGRTEQMARYCRRKERGSAGNVRPSRKTRARRQLQCGRITSRVANREAAPRTSLLGSAKCLCTHWTRVIITTRCEREIATVHIFKRAARPLA